MAEDLYKILGVARTASKDEIRRAYRKLARKHHPDVNPGDKQAEDQFKQVSAAYDVLSDEAKRKHYDEFGEESLRGGFDPDKAREYQRWQRTRRASRAQAGGAAGPEYYDLSGDNLEDLFGGFGGFRARRGPQRGRDLHATVELDLEQAIRGAELAIQQPAPTTIRIPPGADTGSILRIAGKGAPGAGGGPPGDLVIETRVRPHRLFRRDGHDLALTLPVTVDEAYNGATVEIPTFDGPVRLKIPPRSQTGQRLRLRGKGVPYKDRRGDLFAELDVRLPDREHEGFAAAAREAATAYSHDVRKEVRL